MKLCRAGCVLTLAACSAPTIFAQSLLAPESSLPPHRTTLVFGQKIAYYDSGFGPTLVLVHGFASQARFDWGNVIVPLSKHHRVLALDQIGFGASDKPFIDYSIQTYVDFLGEFLRTLHIEKFDLAAKAWADGSSRTTRSRRWPRRTPASSLYPGRPT